MQHKDIESLFLSLASKLSRMWKPGVEELDANNFAQFLDNFGYQIDRVRVFRISDSVFALVSKLESGAELIEVFKYYNFENNMSSLASAYRVSQEGLYILSNNKSYKIIGPYTDEGVCLMISNKLERGFSATSSESIAGHAQALGSFNINKFSALSYFHELWHIRHFNSLSNVITDERAASHFAIGMIVTLRALGINLFNGEIDEIKDYLEAAIQTYFSGSDSEF